MKALMTNSTQADIYTAKMRDQVYLKHLRQVQKINNRQYINLQTQLKYYHNVSESVQKHRKQAKQFQIHQHNNELERKNSQIIFKMKNIRSMYNFNLKRPADIEQSRLTPDQSTIIKDNPINHRYSLQNKEKDEITQINQKISQSITNAIRKIQKTESSPKASRLSLHYYLRKRQQEMIEHENEKLKKGILSQKSTYGSPGRKLNRSLKLPGVKSARHNFNERTIQIHSKKLQGDTSQTNLNSSKTESHL